MFQVLVAARHIQQTEITLMKFLVGTRFRIICGGGHPASGPGYPDRDVVRIANKVRCCDKDRK